MLAWVNRFSIFCFLDSQHYSLQQGGYECIAGVEVLNSIEPQSPGEFDRFLHENKNWAFGHISYNWKNIILQTSLDEPDPSGFPVLFFFIPKVVLLVKGQQIEIIADDPDRIFNEIDSQKIEEDRSINKVSIKQRLSKDDYLKKIKVLKEHILRGDCYEINFCQEFYSEEAEIKPLAVFKKLMELSPNPYSAFYRWNNSYLMCASPEHYMCKLGQTISSQPMKGTIKRNLIDSEEDTKLKQELSASQKDRSENVMIVDLVRNDLSRICIKGSVNAETLFEISAYPQVYQMTSTVTGTLKKDILFSEILAAMFPMGSMTGAPKIKVMELIDKYEGSGRGIFSGCVGYFTPESDFDFNVVIRSIMYNSESGYLSYQAGSGITFYSDPEKEWDECLLKAEAIRKVLTDQ